MHLPAWVPIAWLVCAAIAAGYVTLDLRAEQRHGIGPSVWAIGLRALLCALGPFGLAFYIGVFLGSAGSHVVIARLGEQVRARDAAIADLEAARRQLLASLVGRELERVLPARNDAA